MSDKIPIPDDFGGLFRMARWYGRVRIMTTEKGTYHACIEFNSVAHTKLEASSTFTCTTPDDALRQAIEAAQAIVDSITGMARRLDLAANTEKS